MLDYVKSTRATIADRLKGIIEKRAELVDPDSVYGGGNGAAVDDDLEARDVAEPDSIYGGGNGAAVDDE